MSTLSNFLINNVADKVTPLLQTPVEDIVYEILDRKGLPTRAEVRDLKNRLEKLEETIRNLGGSLDGLRTEIEGGVRRSQEAGQAAQRAGENAAAALAQAESLRSSPPRPAAVAADAPTASERPARTAIPRTPRAATPSRRKGARSEEEKGKRGRPRVSEPALCGVPDCGKATRSKGFCAAHYQTWRRGRLPGFVSADGYLSVNDLQVAVGSKFAGKQAAVEREGDELVIQVDGKVAARRPVPPRS